MTEITELKFTHTTKDNWGNPSELSATAETSATETPEETVKNLKAFVHSNLESDQYYYEWKDLTEKCQKQTLQTVITYRLIKAEYQRLAQAAIAEGRACNLDIPSIDSYPSIEKEIERLSGENPFKSRLQRALIAADEELSSEF